MPNGELAELRAENAHLRTQVAQLTAKVSELQRRLDQNSSNSSKPPSSDPPMTRAQRRALERERAKARRSERKAGGQPGHEGHQRALVAEGRVDQRFDHLPSFCSGCGESFSGSEERIGDPLVQQIWDMPPIKPLVYEHRRARLRCPRCGNAQLAKLPNGISQSAFGPRLCAHIATLAGVYRLSRAQIKDVVEEMFCVPISTGAVDAILMRCAKALADPYAQLQEAVRQAEIVHADETGWRLQGRQQWLWLAASSLLACYRIDPSRSQRAAKDLLGADFGAIAVTDRYRGYLWLDVLQQQLCWAHVIRQLRSLSERGGAPGRLGTKLLQAAGAIFAAHRRYSEGGGDLDVLKRQLKPVRAQIEGLLVQGARCRDKRTSTFCRGLLDDWDALWTFCEIEGIPLTNNQAERGLRHAVIMRKVSLGTQSIAGNHWIERVLSVRETCRLQKRSVLAYLTEATVAYQRGSPAPSLVPP